LKQRIFDYSYCFYAGFFIRLRFSYGRLTFTTAGTANIAEIGDNLKRFSTITRQNDRLTFHFYAIVENQRVV